MIRHTFSVLFQSTLPREERRYPCRQSSNGDISIHAPTRGATANALAPLQPYIFQSTLPREERRVCSLVIRVLNIHFNPRSHERSDVRRYGGFLCRIFQSTLPREERPCVRLLKSALTAFQSTLPREERLLRIALFLCIKNFNPRSHERSDRKF